MAQTLQEILGTQRGRDLTKLPSLLKITLRDIIPAPIQRSVRNFFAPQPDLRIRDVLREIPGTLGKVKEAFFPTYGFSEREINESIFRGDPTFLQKLKTIPNFEANLAAGAITLGELLGDIEGLQKPFQYVLSRPGIDRLADIGGYIRGGKEELIEFATPKTLEEVAAQRMFDIGSLAIGNIKVPRSAVVTIARSMNPGKIANILKQEVPGISDNLSKTLGQILMYVYDPDDVTRVLNRTNFAINKAKGTSLSQAIARVMKERAGVEVGVRPAVSPRQVAAPIIEGISKELDPLAVEARKYKSAEEFVKAQTIDTPKSLQALENYAKSIKDAKTFEYNVNTNRAFIETEPSDIVKLQAKQIMRVSSDRPRLSPKDFDGQNQITIFRTSDRPIKLGDYVYASKEEAQHALSAGQGEKIYSKKIKPNDLIQAGSPAGEYFYSPSKFPYNSLADFYEKIKNKSQLTDFYNQNVKKPVDITPLTQSISKAKASGQSFQTINEGGVMKSVVGKPVKIVDGV